MLPLLAPRAKKQALMIAEGDSLLRLDGSTAVLDRNLIIKRYNDGDAVDNFVFLISTRAGGTGLNLQTANKVRARTTGGEGVGCCFPLRGFLLPCARGIHKCCAWYHRYLYSCFLPRYVLIFTALKSMAFFEMADATD